MTMKNKLLPNPLVWLLVLLLPTACHKSGDDPVAIAVPSCTLNSYTTITEETGLRQTDTGQFDFSADNRLISRTETSEDLGSSARSSKTLTAYTYDSRGFLIESIESRTSKYASGGSSSTSITSFAYTNDRLTKAIHKNTSSGTTDTVTETFAYDGQGKLALYTSKSESGGSTYNTVYTFSGGLLTSVNSAGRELYQFENGRIMESTDGTLRYEYDGQGRRIRYTYTGPTFKSVETYEYESTGQRVESTYPQWQFKGVPYQPIRALYDTGNDLVKRVTRTSESNGKVTSVEETTYAYQLNPKGYPLSQTKKRTASYTDPTGTYPSVTRTSTTTSQFTYRTCD